MTSRIWSFALEDSGVGRGSSQGKIGNRRECRRVRYSRGVIRYHVAYYLLKGQDRMVVAEVLDFPGVVSQGFDLADARLMIASALEDVAQVYLEEGKPSPVPKPDAVAADADFVELMPISVGAGVPRP